MAGAGMAMMGVLAISAIVNLVVISACVNWIIKRPDGSAIGFGRSLLVTLVYMVIFVVISIIVGVVLGMLGMGAGMMAGGAAPDLRKSAVPLDAETFKSVVHDGALMARGMGAFEQLSDADLEGLRHYIRQRARETAPKAN